MVTKGPDSLKVINYARRQGASCVRGNQDDKVLLHYHSYHKKNASAREDDNEEAPVSATEKKLRTEKALSKKMTAKEAEWLDSCPLILRARDVKGLGNVAVVHAGLVQGVPLSKQDPFAVMNMRSINTKSGIPSETREWTHWARFWNKQERAAHSPITVV